MSKRRRHNGAGLTGLIYFALSGVNIENVASWHPFSSVYGCSKKILLSNVNCFFFSGC